MSTLVERLEERTIDYDGSRMDDLEEPRGVVTCGLLREAAAALRATTGEGEWPLGNAPQYRAPALGNIAVEPLAPAPVAYKLAKGWEDQQEAVSAALAAAAPPPPLRTIGEGEDALITEAIDVLSNVGTELSATGRYSHRITILLDGLRGYRAARQRPAEPLRDAGAVAWQFKDSEWTEWAAITEAQYDAYRDGNCTGSGNSFEVRALYTHPAPAQVDEARVLAALGHEPQVSDNCTARVIPTPPDKRLPGPPAPPLWCHLKAGHDGPHRCNHGGGYPSFPFHKSDPVEFREPVTVCTKCRTRWPCPEAEKVSAALIVAAKEGRS